ncbi:histidine kinase [Streptomyces monticola]|uniref:histidine kinase n=1 Tax=Streptomyces monticola TaxID=2666263 RepID=A0ABW2JFD7_9ACTN
MAAVSRDPVTAANALRNDAFIAAGATLLAVALALSTQDGRRPDAVGWVLLVGSAVPLVWRRRHPVLVLLAVVAFISPYHGNDFNHLAPQPSSMIALYTVATICRPLHTLVTGGAVIALSVSVMSIVGAHQGLQTLRTSGWIVAVLFLGVDVRVYRRYIASVVERAERAERSREEEAARRVAEERLRIARDLHDLLAHSITLIGVQTSVASHVLSVDPDRLDRAAISKSLDEIAETCRTARGELRTTLEVLRAGEQDSARGPLPGLDGLPELAAAARASGAKVDLSVAAGPAALAPAVGAAVYRIVQEALTNAVRHAGPDVAVSVEIRERAGALEALVRNDGRTVEATPEDPSTPPGYGLIGMRERARSVGGTLDAGPLPEGGFTVTAVLPTPPPQPSAQASPQPSAQASPQPSAQASPQEGNR